jgi:iron complex transport system permease protein
MQKTISERAARRGLRELAGLAAAIAVLLVCTAISILMGAKDISPFDVRAAILNPDADWTQAIIARKRIIRTVFALLTGAALGLSGTLMQAITRNPVADPGILGVNAGASLAVVIGVGFFGISAANQFVWIALAGAGGAAVAVYAIASLGTGGATPIKLALAGAAMAATLSSLISALLLPRAEALSDFRFWQAGSLGRASTEAILAALPFCVIAAFVGFASAPALNALALGDEAAAGLGVRTGIVRAVNACAGVVLCAASTAFAGPIGFVGLMAPHAVRSVLGTDYRIALPASAIAGAALMTLADVAGRVVARPMEIETGIVTAIIGAPVLIWVATKSGRTLA